MELTRKFIFEAGHYLPKYIGKCFRQHGHRFELFITISGNPDEETGMIIDFKSMSEIVNKVILDEFDHSNLNDIIPNPTAETIVKFIYKTLYKPFEIMGVLLLTVCLYETENSSCSYNYFDYLGDLHE